MKIHPDKVGYFREKSRLRRPEIERKLLDVNQQNIEAKFADLDGVEIFRGEVISFYYGVDIGFLHSLCGVEKAVLAELERRGKIKGFSRLRVMNDQDGVTIYFVETRVKGLEGEALRMDTDYSRVVDSRYDFLHDRSLHDSAFGGPRQIEIKTRLSCIVDGVEGLEYSLDSIKEVTGQAGDVHNDLGIPHYLEVEATRFESYLSGVRLIGATPEDLVGISARKLIAQALEK